METVIDCRNNVGRWSKWILDLSTAIANLSPGPFSESNLPPPTHPSHNGTVRFTMTEFGENCESGVPIPETLALIFKDDPSERVPGAEAFMAGASKSD